MQLKEANAVFSHFGIKAKKLIHASKTITTSPGVQQPIITTGINSGTTVKVQAYQPHSQAFSSSWSPGA